MRNNEKSQRKGQVEWGIGLFRTFILFAARKGTLQPSKAMILQQEVENLAQEAQKEESHETVAEGLNRVISATNQQMKAEVEGPLYAPFPSFSFVKGTTARSSVLDQLDMVERTLTEAAHAEVLTWDVEGGLFNEILKLFTLVEQGKVQPVEAMAALTNSIEKINQSLPEEFRLPSVDLTAYEVHV